MKLCKNIFKKPYLHYNNAISPPQPYNNVINNSFTGQNAQILPHHGWASRIPVAPETFEWSLLNHCSLKLPIRITKMFLPSRPFPNECWKMQTKAPPCSCSLYRVSWTAWSSSLSENEQSTPTAAETSKWNEKIRNWIHYKKTPPIMSNFHCCCCYYSTKLIENWTEIYTQKQHTLVLFTPCNRLAASPKNRNDRARPVPSPPSSLPPKNTESHPHQAQG